MSRATIALCLVALFIFTVQPTYADTKTIISEATYIMGDGETPSFAESMAIQKAKGLALEQAGTYVESYTKVQNYQLTIEEIQTIAGGVLQVEVLDKKRELIVDGLRQYVKIKATVTTDKIQDLVQRIKGKNVVEEYTKLQEDYARLNKEIENWKQLVAKIPAGPEREVALEQIREREKDFVQAQREEAAFLKRLVSGEALYSTAVSQLEAKQSMIDGFSNKLWQQGHIISVGEPNILTNLDEPEKANIRVPIKLEANKAMQGAIDEVEKYLTKTDSYREMRKLMDKFEARQTWLKLNFILDNGTDINCTIWGRTIWKYDVSDYFIKMIKGTSQFNLEMELPLKAIKQIKAVEVKFVANRSPALCRSTNWH